MRKSFYSIIIFLPVIAVGIVLLMSEPQREQDLGVSRPVYLPDPKLTKGKADTLNTEDITRLYNGETYSQSHRNVSEATKREVYKLYGVSYPQPKGAYEVDHLFMKCAGGSDDISNLWLQPRHVLVDDTDWGFITKDQLEASICRDIKTGVMTPPKAYKCMVNDWTRCFLERKEDKVLGAVGDDYEGDDYNE